MNERVSKCIVHHALKKCSDILPLYCFHLDRDSDCLLGLWDELYLCKRLLEIKNSCGDVLRREIKKMETKHGGVRKEHPKITEVLSRPERRQTEWGELCSLRYSR